MLNVVTINQGLESDFDPKEFHPLDPDDVHQSLCIFAWYKSPARAIHASRPNQTLNSHSVCLLSVAEKTIEIRVLFCRAWPGFV